MTIGEITYSQGTSPTSIQSPSLSSYIRTYSYPWRRSLKELSLSPSFPGIDRNIKLTEMKY